MTTKEPGHELHAHVRAGFVAQRTSLYRWCADHGVRRTTADKVLRGERNGPIAKALRQRLIRAAKVKT